MNPDPNVQTLAQKLQSAIARKLATAALIGPLSAALTQANRAHGTAVEKFRQSSMASIRPHHDAHARAVEDDAGASQEVANAQAALNTYLANTPVPYVPPPTPVQIATGVAQSPAGAVAAVVEKPADAPTSEAKPAEPAEHPAHADSPAPTPAGAVAAVVEKPADAPTSEAKPAEPAEHPAHADSPAPTPAEPATAAK